MLFMPVQRTTVLRPLLLGLILLLHTLAYAQSTVPAPWTAVDINRPTPAGRTTYNNGVFTLSSGGIDIAGRDDQFHFVNQAITGDTRLVARIDTLIPADPGSKIGLMIRASKNSSAAHGYVYLSGTNQVAFARRKSGNKATITTTSPTLVSAPVWLAITRVGSTITAGVSADGTTWTTVGSDTVSLGSTAYVGYAITAHSTTVAAQADVSNGQASGLPGNLRNQDIGAPAVAGSARYSNGTYTVVAGGLDIWGTSDQFHYVYQPMTGDVEITARIATFAGPDISSKAGVMIRESLSASAAHAFDLVSTGSGLAYQDRPLADAASEHLDGGSGRAPVWLRLLRTGTRLEAFRSPDGVTWSLIGTRTIALPQTVYVGVAVASHSATATATATFDNLTIRTPATTTNQAPTVTLVAPTANSTAVAPATFSLSANASDPEGRMARVEFYANGQLVGSSTAPYTMNWTNVAAGSYSLTAIAFDQDGAQATSSPVAVTVTAPANQAPTVSLTSPTANATGVAPATFTLSATASDPEGRLARVELYANAALLGSYATAPCSMSWSNVAAGTYALTAVAIDQEGNRTTSTAVTVTVTANQPPSVTLTAPAANATAVTPATFTLAAAASDPEGRLARVEFYANGALLTSDATAPFGYTWSGVTTGTYVLMAAAFDQEGNRTNSPTVTVAVTANQPPTVALTAPAANSTAVAPATFTLAATASDPEGRLARVDFYVNGGLLASDTTSPFSAAWGNVAAGTYTLTAVAADQEGNATTSSPVVVTVTVNQPPTVTLTSPLANATAVAPATFTLAASASDPEGRLARVEFYVNSQLVGSDSSSPFSLTWGNVAAGSYVLSAVAFDQEGNYRASASISVSVTPPVVVTPTFLVFTASADHVTDVTSYRMNVYNGTADPATATPLLASDLGKPNPDANNDISVDETVLLNNLTPGTYLVTVTAFGAGGSAQSPTGVVYTR